MGAMPFVSTVTFTIRFAFCFVGSNKSFASHWASVSTSALAIYLPCRSVFEPRRRHTTAQNDRDYDSARQGVLGLALHTPPASPTKCQFRAFIPCRLPKGRRDLHSTFGRSEQIRPQRSICCEYRGTNKLQSQYCVRRLGCGPASSFGIPAP